MTSEIRKSIDARFAKTQVKLPLNIVVGKLCLQPLIVVLVYSIENRKH